MRVDVPSAGEGVVQGGLMTVVGGWGSSDSGGSKGAVPTC